MFDEVMKAFNRRYKSKPADPMQTVQPADPAQPTVKEMDDIATAFKASRDFWKGRALNAEAELARLKASRERSNANLRRGSAPKNYDAARHADYHAGAGA